MDLATSPGNEPTRAASVGELIAPASPEEAAAVVRAAAMRRDPVYPTSRGPAKSVSANGEGAGVAGRPGAETGVTLVTSRLNRIRELRREDMIAVIEAGVTAGELAAAVASHGLWLPQLFLADDVASIGSLLAQPSYRSPGHGPLREHVLGIRAVLGTGELIQTGSLAIKNATGYNLTQTIIESEASLAVIVEATLRLVPLPGATATIEVPVESAAVACAAAPALATTEPAELELLDAGWASELSANMAACHGPRLLALLTASDEAALAAKVTALARVAATAGLAAPVRLIPEEATNRWAARRRLPWSVLAGWESAFALRLAFPGIVSAEFLAESRRLAKVSVAEVGCFGGVGVGELLIVARLSGGVSARSLARDLIAAAKAHGGGAFAAWSTGLGADEWIELTRTPGAAQLTRQLRAALNPDNTIRSAARL